LPAPPATAPPPISSRTGARTGQAAWERSGTLRIVRTTLDGLLGVEVPLAWDDRTYALAGTGRQDLTGEDRTRLGPLLERFPLLA
jgi:hypothetical protein